MHIHIVGICGTFMSGIALMAKTLGHTVSGCDEHIYPPMSEQLATHGIDIHLGYVVDIPKPEPDLYIIGNVATRGMPIIEHILNQQLPYLSGAQWLSQYVLYNKHVLAVSGTHGKTTTTSILAWLLESAGYDPGFMIGGIAKNFSCSARYTDSKYFVIEADEYDSAFFDKRSKFIHYQPQTLIINNIEFDHSDIFQDLQMVKRAFHHLIRIVPENGNIIIKHDDVTTSEVIEMGCWTPISTFGRPPADYLLQQQTDDYRNFTIQTTNTTQAAVHWQMIGQHNAENAVAAIIAATYVGIPIATTCKALSKFQGIKRRLEKIADIHGISVYDDFSHHPTAIYATLTALKSHIGAAKIMAIIDLASYTMCDGIHHSNLAAALQPANSILLYQGPKVMWDLKKATESLGKRRQVFSNIDQLLQVAVSNKACCHHIVVMSNAGFSGFLKRFIGRLSNQQT